MKRTTKRHDARARNYADDAPLTAKELRSARPMRKAFPALVAAYEVGRLRHRGQRGPQKTPTKIPVNLRVSPEVLRFFKSKGHGWQTRMNHALQAIVEAVK